MRNYADHIQTEKTKYNIPILTKGMELLEIVSQYPQGLTLAELTTMTATPKTSLYRLLCSFVEQGYLVKDEVTARFSLTHKNSAWRCRR